MFFAVFHQKARRVCVGKRGVRSRHGHRFGGPAEYAGLQAHPRQPPVHLLFRLNTADPLVGVRLPTAHWLPLLCAIRYGGCELGYRVLSDDAVKILHQKEKKVWRGFPSEDYPSALPAKPVGLSEGTYDPGDPESALFFSGVFGYDALTPAQFAGVVEHVKREGLYDPDFCEEETPEEYLREGVVWPFLQGPPDDGCPNPNCRCHGVARSLRVFALFQEGERTARTLWGPDGENLQIIYQVCPACSAVLTTNQCT